MIVKPIKTAKISPSEKTLVQIIDKAITELPEKSIVVITSKIVSLCEGSVVPLDEAPKEEIVRKHADNYLSPSHSKYGTTFTVLHNTLIPNAGIDESNAKDVYVLWPKDPTTTANDVRRYLKNRLGLQHVGVIITDSTSRPMRLGTTGIALGFSGFVPLKSYVGEPDLFGRSFKTDTADIAGGLAASAVLTMGEGAEQTPIAIVQDVPFVEFVSRDPTDTELETLGLNIDDDLFEPFLTKVDWQSP
jgi:putative folate metabolism gamma-glutamate ligase